MKDDDVPDDALLQLLVAERFPRWTGVRNEQAAATAAAERRLAELSNVRGIGESPDWTRDDELARARRRRLLNEAMVDLDGLGMGRRRISDESDIAERMYTQVASESQRRS